MDIDPIYLAAGTGTILCVVVDGCVHAIRRTQRHHANLYDEGSFFISGRILLSILLNVVVCAGFAVLYQKVFDGTMNAFGIACVIWAMVAGPLLLLTSYMDDIQKRSVSVRTFGWLIKLTGTAGVLVLFLSE